MPSADPIKIVAQIYALLNRPSIQKLPPNDVKAARIAAGMEILRAITPQNGYFGSIATLVTVTHNTHLPAHDGEPGIPLIVPYAGADPMAGIPATPEEIDSYRLVGAAGAYSGAYSGATVAHNASAGGLPSPVAGRYSIVNKYFKFTGHTAQIPLVQLTRAMADTGVPEVYEATIVKLAIPRLVKPEDPLFPMASTYGRLGAADLVQIATGALEVSPVPDVTAAQKMGVT